MANTIKTKRFIAPTEGTISFHRITSVEVYCDGQEAGTYEVDPNADVPDTWREVQLATKDASVILDTSSFVVELVNLTDNTVITLDSVCIMPNPGHMMPATGTTDATSVMFNVAIPPSCWGDTVYVRAVPYRWGPTPFGMTSSMTRSDISLSTLYKQMPTDLLSLSRLYNHTAFYDTLDNWRLNDLIMYMGSDTVRQCTPVVFGGIFLPDTLMPIFESYLAGRGFSNSYCACLEEYRNDSLLIGLTLDPPVTSFGKGAPFSSTSSQRSASNLPELVIPNCIITDIAAFTVKGPKASATISLYDLQGRFIGKVWEGATPTSGTLRVPAGLKGAHILTLQTAEYNVAQGVRVQME